MGWLFKEHDEVGSWEQQQQSSNCVIRPISLAVTELSQQIEKDLVEKEGVQLRT